MKQVLILFLFPILTFGQTIIIENKIHSSDDIDFSDIIFINKKTGFVVGSWGTILKTNDFGESWTDISINNSDILKIEGIDFIDTNTVIVVGGPGVIYKTNDSGFNWYKVYNKENSKSLTNTWFYSLNLINDNLFFAFGRPGSFVVSKDKGESWSLIKLDTVNRAFGELSINTRPFYITSNSGLHSLNYFPNNDSISTNQIYYTGHDTPSLQFFDSDNGWAVGQGCSILRMKDKIVKDVGIPNKTENAYLKSLYFHNMKEGWVCGNQGTFLYTKNGGKKWFNIIGFPKVPLNKILFITNEIGFIAGDGVLYKTIDKGITWQLILKVKNQQGNELIKSKIK